MPLGRELEDLLDESVRINKMLRVSLHELLDSIQGLGQRDRDRLAPRVEKMLEDSERMPTAVDVVRARRTRRGDDSSGGTDDSDRVRGGRRGGPGKRGAAA